MHDPLCLHNRMSFLLLQFCLSGTNQFAFQIKYIYVFTNSFPTCNRLSVRVKIVTVFVNGFPFIFQFITLFVVINIFLSFFYKTFLSSQGAAVGWTGTAVTVGAAVTSGVISEAWAGTAYSHNTDCYNCQKFAYLSHTLSLPNKSVSCNQPFRRQTISQRAAAELKFSGTISAGVIVISNSSWSSLTIDKIAKESRIPSSISVSQVS